MKSRARVTSPGARRFFRRASGTGAWVVHAGLAGLGEEGFGDGKGWGAGCTPGLGTGGDLGDLGDLGEEGEKGESRLHQGERPDCRSQVVGKGCR